MHYAPITSKTWELSLCASKMIWFAQASAESLVFAYSLNTVFLRELWTFQRSLVLRLLEMNTLSSSTFNARARFRERWIPLVKRSYKQQLGEVNRRSGRGRLQEEGQDCWVQNNASCTSCLCCLPARGWLLHVSEDLSSANYMIRTCEGPSERDRQTQQKTDKDAETIKHWGNTVQRGRWGKGKA